MSLIRTAAFAACAIPFAAMPALALDVAASIKPVHSLVAAVMEGVGAPALIVASTGSEHAYSLKPSEADALDRAEIAFYVGPHMETFLEKPLETLAADARVVALEGLPGIQLLPIREGGAFEAHEHHEEEHAHAGEEDGHDDEAHGHSHDHEEEAGHHDVEHDLHFWLDPLNARAAVTEIARVLAEADAANGDAYKANAAAYGARLDTLAQEIETVLSPVKGKPFIVFHDAYQYFEKRFGLSAAGSITVNPEVAPGAQRVAEMQAKVRELGVACVFSEPQFESSLVETIIEGSTARTGVLDPLGSSLPVGPDLYPQLIRDLATSLRTCLADAS
jgi:zinc transport system substrate-binding protein